MKSKVTTRIQAVTMEQAKRWLDRNRDKDTGEQKGNRHLSNLAVDGYAKEMSAGRWVLTGDAIMFNEAGELVNGQHRLTAMVQAGVSCEFLIMENVEPSAREAIDQGRARSVPDMLRMFYGQSRATMITGAIRVLDQALSSERYKLSVGHALACIAKYDEAFKWAVKDIPGKSNFFTSPVIAALIYAYKTAPASVEMFSRRLASGADLPPTSPILALRNHIQKTGALVYMQQRREIFMLTLTAIHKTIKNDPVRNLKIRADIIEQFSEVYRINRSRRVA